MVQNLKIDVIYYDTPSDFEFEFNLGGCCHSRILNSHTHQPKEMLSSLAKAVGRSRVIIVVGNLYEESGLINLVSKAIGIPLTEADAAEYVIKEPAEPMILEGSLPLVSNDGILSGCIVESGPQSIILLPDTKSLRKDICDNLVFSYITALSHVPETDNIITEENPEDLSSPEDIDTIDADISFEDVNDAVENELEEVQSEETEGPSGEEVFEETVNESFEEEFTEESLGEAENKEAEDDTEIVFSKDDSDTIFSGNKIEINDTDNEEHVELSENFVLSDEKATNEEDGDNYISDDESARNEYKPLSKLTVAILILCGLLLVIGGALLFMLVYEPIANSAPVFEYIKEIFNFI